MLHHARRSSLFAVRGTGITPRLTPLPPAASLGRETSRTDPALLDELLPFMEHHTTGGRMGAAACTLNLAKATLGAGLVAMPHAFVLVGAMPASCTLTAVHRADC
jgi:hypothetical protein